VCVLQCGAGCRGLFCKLKCSVHVRVAVCCGVLQCVAVSSGNSRCSVRMRVAVCCGSVGNLKF